MTMQVKLGGQLRSKIGHETIVIEWSGGSPCLLGGVLDQIAEQHAGARDLLLKSGGAIAAGLLVLLDDAAVVPTRDLDVTDASTVTLLTAISGG